jgi:hypothetical protein
MPKAAETKGRGTALAGTLHDAETRQLEDFIRKRSKALDGDINEMRRRLGGKLANDPTTVGVELDGGNFIAPVNVEGMKISGVSLLTHSQGMAVGANDSPIAEQEAAARKAAMERAQPPLPRAASMKDRLGTFLARIKISKLVASRCLC